MKKIPWYARGNSGKLGELVYYNLFDKTYVRKAPGSYNVVPTEKQAIARERFIAAHRFAQSVIADPSLKALYDIKAAGKRTAYSQAMADFLNHEDTKAQSNEEVA